MAEQTARTFMLASLIFLATLLGSFSYLSSAVSSSSGDLGNYNQTLARLSEIQNEADDIRESIEDPPTLPGSLGILESFIEGTVGVAKQLWSSVNVMNDVFADMTEGAFGIRIPLWLTSLFGAIILITVAFALMSAWFKWRI